MASGEREYIVTAYVPFFTLVRAKDAATARRRANKRGLFQGCAPSPKVAWLMEWGARPDMLESSIMPSTKKNDAT